MQSYFFSSHDGFSMAVQWRTVLNRIGITKSDQISAIAADGQYHQNKIPQEFLSLLDNTQTDLSCVPKIWDQGIFFK